MCLKHHRVYIYAYLSFLIKNKITNRIVFELTSKILRPQLFSTEPLHFAGEENDLSKTGKNFPRITIKLETEM